MLLYFCVTCYVFYSLHALPHSPGNILLYQRLIRHIQLMRLLFKTRQQKNITFSRFWIKMSIFSASLHDDDVWLLFLLLKKKRNRLMD